MINYFNKKKEKEKKKGKKQKLFWNPFAFSVVHFFISFIFNSEKKPASPALQKLSLRIREETSPGAREISGKLGWGCGAETLRF